MTAPCVVVVTGPPGAGKSSVATALHDALGAAGRRNALIEVDELERCYPPLDQERVLAHVAMLCASFRAGGYDLLIVTATIEHDRYGERLLQATGAATPARRSPRGRGDDPGTPPARARAGGLVRPRSAGRVRAATGRGA